MLKSTFNPPDYIRRGIRLGLGLGIATFIGYAVIIPERSDFNKQLSMACKWAAITCVVVTVPLIGKVSQVSLERIIGTVTGGFLGFLVFEASQRIWDEQTAGLMLCIAASCVGFLSAWLGYVLQLDTSSRLFAITFLLVTFGAGSTTALKLALTRISGICGGVLLSVLLSIVVFPKSASEESVRSLESALKGLKSLTHMVWATSPDMALVTVEGQPKSPPSGPIALNGVNGGGTQAKGDEVPEGDKGGTSPGAAGLLSKYFGSAPKRNGYMPLPAGDTESQSQQPPQPQQSQQTLQQQQQQQQQQQSQQQSQQQTQQQSQQQPSALQPPSSDPHQRRLTTQESLAAAWAAEETHQAECERIMTKIYTDLQKMEENLPLAAREIAVPLLLTGRTLFLPGFRLWGDCCPPYLNAEDVKEVADCVRRITRILWALHLALQEGFDEHIREVLWKQYPGELLPHLAQYSEEAVESLLEAFPCGRTLQYQNMANFTEAVQTMKHYSDSRRQKVVQYMAAVKNSKRVRGAGRRKRAPNATSTIPTPPNSTVTAPPTYSQSSAPIWGSSPPGATSAFLSAKSPPPAGSGKPPLPRRPPRPPATLPPPLPYPHGNILAAQSQPNSPTKSVASTAYFGESQDYFDSSSFGWGGPSDPGSEPTTPDGRNPSTYNSLFVHVPPNSRMQPPSQAPHPALSTTTQNTPPLHTQQPRPAASAESSKGLANFAPPTPALAAPPPGPLRTAPLLTSIGEEKSWKGGHQFLLLQQLRAEQLRLGAGGQGVEDKGSAIGGISERGSGWTAASTWGQEGGQEDEGSGFNPYDTGSQEGTSRQEEPSVNPSSPSQWEGQQRLELGRWDPLLADSSQHNGGMTAPYPNPPSGPPQQSDYLAGYSGVMMSRSPPMPHSMQLGYSGRTTLDPSQVDLENDSLWAIQRNFSITSDPLMFPDTLEGSVSQVRWYSFQFLMDEMEEELQDLYYAVSRIDL